jgi:hypothetical protein
MVVVVGACTSVATGCDSVIRCANLFYNWRAAAKVNEGRWELVLLVGFFIVTCLHRRLFLEHKLNKYYMKKENFKKAEQYTARIVDQLTEMFKDESCSNHIPLSELSEGDNLKCFIHAMSCASAMMFCKLTGEEKNWLEFNHVANSLCFEFMVKNDNEKF